MSKPADGALARPVVLFDLDGTVSDSAPGILAALRHAFSVTGLPQLDPVTERTLLGPPFYESLPPLIGGEARLPEVIEAYRGFYTGADGSMYDTEMYAGVGDVLRALAADGRRIALATSKPEVHAVEIVEHLGVRDCFTTIGGDALDGSLGTKALVVGEVLRRLGEPDPADVVMIGDRRHDVAGARVHGIDTIGVTWGYAGEGELADADPVAVVSSAAELASLLGVQLGAAS